FHYFFNPKASRSYTLDSVVKKVVVSNNKKYVAASDLENNIYLFSYGGGPDLSLLYKNSFDEEAAIGDLVVIGPRSFVTRLLVFTDYSIFVYSSDFSTPLWSWNFDGAVTDAKMSNYGDITVVGTESGKLYFFRTFEEKLEWVFDCDSQIMSLAISPFASYVLAGSKNGSVYLFDVKNETLIWKWDIGSSVAFVQMRSSATQCLVGNTSGSAYIMDRGGSQLKMFEDVDIGYLSFWGNYIGIARGNKFQFVREERKCAEWEYFSEDPIRYMDSSFGSEYVMLTCKDSIAFFVEEQIIIMGSRFYWSLFVLLLVAQILVIGYLSYLQKGALYMLIKNREVLEFAVGAFGGLIAVLVMTQTIDTENTIVIVIGAISSGFASWQCSRLGGGFVGAFAGYVAGFFSSLTVGAAFGLYYWLGGLEQNIVSSIFGTAFFGGLLGAVFSIIGVIVGLAIKDYFEEYRFKMKNKKGGI
ncbi:MAG: PQQ-binding-like beta-propeller repeat protein, partial [Candidatus Methanofastidiosia archaeon]